MKLTTTENDVINIVQNLSIIIKDLKYKEISSLKKWNFRKTNFNPKWKIPKIRISNIRK